MMHQEFGLGVVITPMQLCIFYAELLMMRISLNRILRFSISDVVLS
jgi:hypothetical protein